MKKTSAKTKTKTKNPKPAPVRLSPLRTMSVPLTACTPMAGANRTTSDVSKEFLENIRTNGILQPAVVRQKGKTYEIIAGQRRYRAALELGLANLPVVVIEADNARARELRMIENLQREDLTAFEEAMQYRQALDDGHYGSEKAGVTALAAKLNCGMTRIYEKLQFLTACAAVIRAVNDGKLPWSTALALSRVPTLVMQTAALKEVMAGVDGEDGPMNFRQTQVMLGERYRALLRKVKFDLDATYQGVIEGRLGKGCQLVDVGPCAKCPRREDDICLDPPCCAAKSVAHADLIMDEAKARGQTVFGPKEARKLFWESGRLSTRDFIDLADICAEMGWEWQKTWKETLGTHAPVSIVAVDLEDRIHELLRIGDALKALKATGLEKPKESESDGASAYDKPSDEVKTRIKRLKACKAVVAAAVPSILHGLWAGSGLAGRVWPLLARAVFDCTDIARHDAMAKRRGLAKVLPDAREGIEKWLAAWPSTKDLMEFVVECLLLAPGVTGGSYEDPQYTESFLAAADLAGVEVQIVEGGTNDKA